MEMLADKKDISLVLYGEAGQGVQTVENILTELFRLAGFNVFATKEYMSRVRGGSNSTSIRISPERVSAFVDRIDLLIPLSKEITNHTIKRISPSTIIISEKANLENIPSDSYNRIIEIPFSEIANTIGGTIYANIVAVGAVSGLFKLDLGLISSFLQRQFAKKGEEIINKNIEAVKRGYDFINDLIKSGEIKEIALPVNPQLKNEFLLGGADAVSLGAIAGGCNFISSYPMSPSTGVLTFLSQYAGEFGIVAEQAEDEISAINMAVGAWYAGGRAVVTTSGGGYALMIEGVSLAGMLETPVVVHLAQRPGPATGLPTRTEQGDLEFVLYSGHGEFPRIILAPSRNEDAFYLSQSAFNLADKYQVPVFILTDQYLMDSYYNVPSLDLSQVKVEKYITKTKPYYKRYELTEDGISPRGIPAYGEGLVGVDSDEHDEEAHITEDLDLRTKMVNKRLRKLEKIKKDVIPPELIGNEIYYTTIVVGWGSTYNIIKEALEKIGRKDIAFLHFNQLYPLHSSTKEYLEKAKKRIIIENNATSQFGKLIKLCTGIDIENKILKYNGLPFSVEEIVENVKVLI